MLAEEGDPSMRTGPCSRPSMDVGQRILPLSSEAISQIHSSKNITSLQGVILSLLENSLDAGATKVDISVNWWRGACAVEDNGAGITPAEFAERGCLGKMYCTSKRAPAGPIATDIDAVHGSTGTFLAELAAMSLLKISSWHRGSEQPASIIMHHGKVIGRPSPDSIILASSNGTSVSVEDLFGSMPVRVKQRELTADSGNGDAARWQELKHGIAALLLAWPNPCFVRLRDDAVESRVLNLSGQHPSITGLLTEKGLHRLAGKPAKFDIRDALPILFQAGLASHTSKTKWIPLSASTPSISLKGLICADAVPTKSCQFVALGIHPCTSNSSLHELVNKLFTRSSFGTVEDPDNGIGDYSNVRSKKKKTANPSAHVRKGVDRNPMYVLQLSFRHTSDHFLSDAGHISDATFGALVDIVQAAITAWLESNHFRPQRRRKRRHEDQESPAVVLTHPRQSSSTINMETPIAASKIGDVSQDNKNTQPQTGQREQCFSRCPRSARYPVPFESSMPRVAPPSTDFTKIRTGNTTSNLIQINHGVFEESHGPGWGNTTAALDPEAGSKLSTPVIYVPNSSTRGGLAVPSSDEFGSVDEADLLAAVGVSISDVNPDDAPQGEDGTLAWTEPATNQVLQVNSRTGVVLPPMQACRSQMATSLEECVLFRERACVDQRFTSASTPLSIAHRTKVAAKENSESSNNESWLPGFLRDWKNPTFNNQNEEPIPVASLAGPGVIQSDERSTSSPKQPGLKLSKSALQHASVIGQVDSKFILCKLPGTGLAHGSSGAHDKLGEVLVLLDQHAASERIILEEIFDGLCTTSTEANNVAHNQCVKTIRSSRLVQDGTREKPLQFEIPQHDSELFNQYREHFNTLGITYTMSSTPRKFSSLTDEIGMNQHSITVTHLPTVIAERCANFPSLCIDMLRSELWQLADGTKLPRNTLPAAVSDGDAECTPYWTSILPIVPIQLISMLHSRACRSAIMFNDPLTLEQCEDLVRKLSHCVFPFVCAHGRVGIVPLGDLGGEKLPESIAGLGEMPPFARAKRHDNQSIAYGRDMEYGCTCAKLREWMALWSAETK